MSEELFDVNKMEKSLKKAQRKSILKTIMISVSVILLLGVISVFVNRLVVNKTEQPIQISFDAFQTISNANEFISTTEYYPGILGGETYYKTFKFVGGTVVYTGEGGYGYGLFRNERLNRSGFTSPNIFFGRYDGQQDIQYYNELGQRMMVFYYPNGSYKRIATDLTKLDEINEDKLVEVGLSFDKGYSIAEALNLFDTIQPTWLWVQDVTEEESQEQYERSASDGSAYMASTIRNEHTVYGFSLLTNNGDLQEEPVQQFIRAIETGKQYKSRWRGEFERLAEVIGGEDGIQEEDIVIYGAIVSGTAEELKALQQAPFVRASSFGVITDRY